MVRDLNQMLEDRMQSKEPKFDEFMEKYGDMFPGVNTLDELLEQMQRRMAAMQAMMDSISPEMREQLQQMMDQLDRRRPVARRPGPTGDEHAADVPEPGRPALSLPRRRAALDDGSDGDDGAAAEHGRAGGADARRPEWRGPGRYRRRQDARCGRGRGGRAAGAAPADSPRCWRRPAISRRTATTRS